jgi:hypothetical protein
MKGCLKIGYERLLFIGLKILNVVNVLNVKCLECCLDGYLLAKRLFS